MSNKVTLSNGREVSLLCNINAFEYYCDETGLGLESLEMQSADIKKIKAICWASAMEGEESEGRKLELTPKEFGRLVTSEILIKMLAIVTPQLAGKKKDQPPTMMQNIFYRK